MQIAIDNISKYFESGKQRLRVLDGVSANFDQGRFIALVGRSGSGKSTLLNLIGGLDEPDDGEIRIGDQIINRIGDTERTLFRRHNLGFVFQFFNLLPTLTVIENVLLPLNLTGAAPAEARRRALESLAEVGITDNVRRYPEQLSGGEQQRVAIARALTHRPSIVLADEPTGNLDLATAIDVVKVLDDVCRHHGTTLIMATHSPEVIGYADDVFEVRDANLEMKTR